MSTSSPLEPLDHPARRTLRTLKTSPTFAVKLAMPTDEAVRRLRAAVTTPGLRGVAEFAGDCLDFRVELAVRRFWSPHLSVQVHDASVDGVAGGEVFGRFLPRPEVWTGFAALYFVAAFAAVGGGVYGYVQWALDARPSALLLVPAGLVTIAGLYAASLAGQRLSHDQIELLQERFDRALHVAFDGELRPPT